MKYGTAIVYLLGVLLLAQAVLAQTGGLGSDTPAAQSLQRALQSLRSIQRPDGSWSTPMESDVSTTGHFVLLCHYLQRVDRELEKKLVQAIRSAQNAEGGWSLFPGGPSAVDATVVSYAALKLSGAGADDPALVKARPVIARLGGLGCTGIWVRAMLALLGQVPLAIVPYATPKLVSVPSWFHPNLNDLPFVRTGLVPLGLLVKWEAVRPVPPELGIAELGTAQVHWHIRPDPPPEMAAEIAALDPAEQEPAAVEKKLSFGVVGRWLRELRDKIKTGASWFNLSTLTRLSHVVDRVFVAPGADRRAVEWLLQRQERDGTLAGSFGPSTMFLMALDAAPGQPYGAQVDRGLAGLKGWLVSDGRGTWQQLAQSSTWDTATGLGALLVSETPAADPAVLKAVSWLTSHQAKAVGEWVQFTRWKAEPGGWYFGEAADYYPDTDDTAVALRSLYLVRGQCEQSFVRGLDWLLAMQDSNGGWAPWSRNQRDRLLMSFDAVMPGLADLADPDVTARVLVIVAPLVGSVYDRKGVVSRAVRDGLRFLLKHRRPDGTWKGHWYVNYAYGTAQVLEALAWCRVDPAHPAVSQAVAWLESIQHPDGGWGESRESLRTGHYEDGPSNVMVTSIVVQALVALGRARTPAVERAVAYLVATQEADGFWQDREFNGVAIPQQAYLRYYLSPTCAAATALAQAIRGTPVPPGTGR